MDRADHGHAGGSSRRARCSCSGPLSFYVVRFLLGVAEAGFFPGIILYLTYWFPAAERARAVALFMTAIAIAGVIGGPLSGGMLTGSTASAGCAGWQWLFLIEGMPSVLLGVVVLFFLARRAGGGDLADDGRTRWLAERLRGRGEGAADARAPHARRGASSDGRVLALRASTSA